MGFLISFAGNISYPKAQNIRDVAKALPLDNILIETDSPYLAPQPHRGKRNEPAYVLEVAKALANVRNLALRNSPPRPRRISGDFFDWPGRAFLSRRVHVSVTRRPKARPGEGHRASDRQRDF